MGELRRWWLRSGTSLGPRRLHLEQHGPVIAIVVGLVCALILISTRGHYGVTLTMVILAAVGVLAFFFVREFMTAITYEVSADAPPSFVALGQTFRWGVSIRARKAFVLQAGRIVLRCQEHAVEGVGRSTTDHRHTVYEHTYRIPPQQLGPGESADLTAEISIPASAIPAYPERRNCIEWTLSFEAPVEGICPDIKEETELRVVPVVEPGGDTSADGNPSIPAKWLESAVARSRVGAVQDGPLSVMIWPGDGQMPHALPVVAAGETREMNLTLQSLKDINCRGVSCWIGCRLHGRGTEEEVVVSKDVPVHRGPLPGGQTVNVPLSVRIPPSGPVTYAGRYANFEWLVRLNLHIPLWWDRQVEVPFVVTPRLAPAPGRQPAASQASTP